MNERELFEFLQKQARDSGIVPVRNACDRFLKMGLRAANVPTPRTTVPRQWTVDLWRKQLGICARCKDQKPVPIAEATFDHIIPLAEGGLHKRSNGRMVHKSCNSSKGAKNLTQERKATGQLFDKIIPTEDSEDHLESNEIK
jgi:5-methylcytosine-specific restriction endonuclease McrA